MDTTTLSAVTRAAPAPAKSLERSLLIERVMMPVVGFWLLGLTLWGFIGTLRLIRDPMGLPLLIKVHGFASFAWIVLFVVQASLMGVGRRDIHRRLGIAAAVVLVVMIPTGYGTVIRAMALDRRTPAEGALLLATLSVGYAYVVMALCVRRQRPAVHARSMLFGTVFLTSLAVDRVSYLAGFVDTAWLVTLVRVVPCAAVLAVDVVGSRSRVWFDIAPIVVMVGIDVGGVMAVE
jgi:hypothetical protein